MGTAVNLPGQPRTADTVTDRGGIGTFRRALPVFPNTLFQMNAVLSSSPVNLARLIAVVGDDPAMTANLLRESKDLDRDVICDQLLDAIIGVGVRKLQAMLVRTPLMTGVEANSAEYHAWRNHSVLAATFAEAIARVAGARLPGQARMAGLLHDIGKLPLLLRYPLTKGAVEEVWSDAALASTGRSSHCELGSELAESWQFSDALCEAIRDHHTENTAPGVLAVVIAADRLCHRCGVSLDAQMVKVYGEMPLADILSTSLPWLSEEEHATAREQARRAYNGWQRSHPGVATATI